MKKKILSGIFALALLITAGYGVSKSVNGNADLSLLALSNVESLAQSEDPPNVIPCYGTIRTYPLDPDEYEPVWTITFCNGCELATCYEYKDPATCTTGGFIYV